MVRLSKSTRSKSFVQTARLVRRVRALPSSLRRGMIEITVVGVFAVGMLAVAFYPSASAGRGAGKAAPSEARTAAAPVAPLADTDMATPALPEAVTAAAVKPAPVTITGCLERDEETFQLKDTAGAAAPKSRSWKTGFLKKRPASIEVVDATKRLKLTNYVGQRVRVTGVLVKREMQGRSLQRVAGSCTDGAKTKA
jgi:hypothetical protein